jgi:serine/threonine protein kinase/Tol biopolymer transport system component
MDADVRPTIGSRLGSYDILSTLGAGGMGEVYRARDTKLNRDVAIKVLLPTVANDPDRLARFSREAQVLASLNHPNIAAIYGLEETPADVVSGFSRTTALVMELVEGEDLSQRIARGAIPIDEALPIARQIAEALEAAHDHGIIHRDLKPANIKICPDGTVKVLDFGLAKAVDPASGSSAAAMNSPTLSIHATEAGMILGTAAYMSPEQAAGKAVDKRSDLWAFGVVLLEMLTGRQTFAGESTSHVLAAVLKDEPDWSALPPGTPPAVRTLLRRCLQKDRKRRLDSAAAARIEIDDATNASNAPTQQDSHSASGSRMRLRIALAAAAVLAVLAAALAVIVVTSPRRDAVSAVRSTIVLNENLASRPPSNRFALSPDGRNVAYVGQDFSGGPILLWTRPLDSSEGRALAGTEGASGPFWSPDSRFIAFTAGGKLKKIDATGGSPILISDAASREGGGDPGTWSQDDVIVLPAVDSSALVRVSATGRSAPSPVTIPDAAAGETRHGFPFFLPDGKHFLYVAYNSLVPLGLYVGSLDSAPRVQLLQGVSNAQYVDGYLMFVRGTMLMAQPFDAATLSFAGEAQPIGEQVQMNTSSLRASAFSVSQAGALIYQAGVSGGGNARVVWSDRSGRQTPVLTDSAPYRDVWLSPDGVQASSSLFDDGRGSSDIWIIDVIRGLRSRFSFDPADEYSGVWSPDGTDMAFNSRRRGRLDLYRKPARGAGGDEVLLADQFDKTPTSWSPDRQFILYNATFSGTQSDVWVLPLSGARKPFPLIESPFLDGWAQFSPDGRWVAYSSDESGRSEVYVAPFPGPGAKWQISEAGGTNPRWRRDGKELFYHSPSELISATVRIGQDRIVVEALRPLFNMRSPGGGMRSFYDVSSDGQRFLHSVAEDQSVSTPLSLVTNWAALLRNEK